MKPLIRWTIGPVSDTGFEILEYSVRQMVSLYGDTFDYIICYNNIDEFRLKSLNVPLYKQSEKTSLMFAPKGVAWKLYPPRLRINSHEIFIDNDLVIFDYVDAVEKFLDSDDYIFCTSGINYSVNTFSKLSDLRLNTGFFGVPPNFDLGIRLNYLMSCSRRDGWFHKFDEQGILTAIFDDHGKLLQVPLDEVGVCDEFLPTASSGIHFVKANRHNFHGWSCYKNLLSDTHLL